MDINQILELIDQQIAKLEQACALLTDSTISAVSSTPAGKRRGRPRGSVNRATKTPVKISKRTMSEEGKQRIAAAQKARWAAQKKSAKAAAKKPSPAKKSARKTAAKPVAATAEA